MRGCWRIRPFFVCSPELQVFQHPTAPRQNALVSSAVPNGRVGSV